MMMPGSPISSLRSGLFAGLLLSSSVCPALATVPAAAHVIVIVMENKSYDQVRTAPYTAGLIAVSSSFSASYAVTHPSQPNYLALWSGGTQGVTDDQCPPPGAPFTAENLGHACEAAGIPWRAYCENLPSPGYAGCSADGGLYHRRHAPWTDFSNLDHSRERPFEDLASDIAAGTLPRLAFVIPNNCDNTHDCPISTGDAWLAAHVPDMVSAVGAQGFVVLTWDEDDDNANNNILTVFAGGLVRSGYVSPRPIRHYTVLRTITDALGVAPFGAAVNEAPITDVWLDPAAVGDERPGAGRSDPGERTDRRSVLEPIRPDPSRGAVEATLRLETGARVRAGIYDAAGRQMALLLDGFRTGAIPLRWNGLDAGGRRAARGIYFLRVRAGVDLLAAKVVVIE
jgi:hypothetical protein